MEEENNISENTSANEKNINEIIKSSEEEKHNNENIVTSSSSSVHEKSDERNENQINANVSPKCMNNNQCKKANNQQQQHQQQQQQHKKYNNRRRKRSFRTRKNSGNFKFNPKGKRRDLLFNRSDQALRHQLFFTDSQRLVPYNTNEFLMEDHYPKISPNFNYHPYNHDSFSSSDCGMSGSLDEDEFLTKEFRMDYENLRSERLHEMSKEQLIQEYLKLENQTELSMKAKENEILALNNKIKDLTRRLTTQNKNGNDVRAESEDSESDSSSSSSSSSCSSSESECEMEHNANDEYTASVITEPQTVSC